MPSVGTRRSTRVFLPKSKVGDGCGVDSGSVVLRSGKRFFSGHGRRVVEDKPKVTPCDKSPVFCRGNGWGVPVEVDKCQSEKKGTDAVEVDMVSPCRRFGVVYSRKRKRLDSDGHCSRSDDDGEYSRFRIAFVRKRRINGLSTREERPIFRPKVSIWKTGVLLGRHEIAEASRGFALKVGILDTDIWSGSGGRWVFLVLIDTSDCTNILHFSWFLSSTLVAMRRKRVKMVQVASFLLSRALSDVFSKHGVHFLPVNLDSYISCRNAIHHAGFCGINGSHKSVPLLSLNFSALPFYFKSLYLSKILHPVRFVSLLGHIRVPWWDCRRVDMSKLENIAPKCTGKSKTPPMERCEFLNEKTHNEFCDREKSNLPSIVLAVESPYFLQESMLAFQNRKANALRVRKYQQKRTALRSARVTTPLKNAWRNTVSSIHKSILSANNSSFKGDSLQLSTVEPHRVFRKTTDKNLACLTKELKSSILSIKQNIDTTYCHSNILIIGSDNCWSKENAVVMMEATDFNDWFLAIKVEDSVRYLFKPQEFRPCTTNQYNQSIIWSAEKGWKLEFDNEIEWLKFKELLKACSYRNSQESTVRMIPVPRVKTVTDYDNFHCTFSRPVKYICTPYDEIERALISENTCYDMDCADENWLRELNSNFPDAECGGFNYVSDDIFEKIIFELEKFAYRNPDAATNLDMATKNCLNFGSKDVVTAIFNYWLKRKREKEKSSGCSSTALVRFFQYPTKKSMVFQKPLLRKKRSLKRQRSQSGCDKVDMQVILAIQEDLKRVKEAEIASHRALDTAIKMRSKVQILMINADLATYKADMAVRTEGSLGAGESDRLQDHWKLKIELDDSWDFSVYNFHKNVTPAFIGLIKRNKRKKILAGKNQAISINLMKQERVSNEQMWER